MIDEDIYAPFWTHIEELRKTFLRMLAVILCGMLISFIFYTPIINFLTNPLQTPLVILGPLEGIMIALKTSLWIGAVITSPIWLFLISQFIAPALKKEEKRLLVPFMLLSILFSALGGLLAFTITIPFANTYLAGFNAAIGSNLWSLSHYLDYTIFLLLANALAFELAVVGFFAVHLGIISAESLIDKRRLAIVGTLILAALLTPPDVITQILLAIPLMILYEGIILYARFRTKITS